MKLKKNDLEKLKGEYQKIGFRSSWSKEEDELLLQLIENGIFSPQFVKDRFFPNRTNKAVGKRLSDMRRELSEKSKS